MATNVFYDDNTTARSYFGYGLIADMGPYTGPWPLMAPAVIDGTYGMVIFYLALPNPAEPDDPRAAADGSYGTGLFQARRYSDYWNPGTTFESYWNDYVPYGAGPPPTDPAAGMHLYVLIDWDPSFDGPPAFQPGHYVPLSYSPFGFAEFQTAPGSWSPVQPGPVVEHGGVAGNWSDHFYYGQALESVTAGTPPDYRLTYPPLMPPWDEVGIPAEQAAFSDLGLGGGTAWWRVRGESRNFELTTPNTYIPPLVPAYELTHESGVGLGEISLSFFARTEFDGIGGGLAWMVDYGPSPNPDTGYESFVREPGQVVPEWLDCPNPFRQARAGGASSGSGVTGTGGAFSNSGVSGVYSFVQCWLRLPTGGADDDFYDYFNPDLPPGTYPAPPTPYHGGPVGTVAPGWALAGSGEQDYAMSCDAGGVSHLVVSTSWEGGSDEQSDTGNPGGGVQIQVLRDVLPIAAQTPLGTPAIQLVWSNAWLMGQDAHPAWIAADDPPQPHLIGTGYTYDNELELEPVHELDRLFPDLLAPGTPEPYAYFVGGGATATIDPDTGRPYNYRGPPYLAHNPPWRYWRPNTIVPSLVLTEAPFMRLNQRSDGLGVTPTLTRAPAGVAAGNQTRTEQAAATRRIGGRNTFY